MWHKFSLGCLRFGLLLSVESVSDFIQDILNRDITELTAEHVLLILFDDRDVTAHNIEHAYILPIKDLALQQAQDLEAVFALDKECEQWKQLVIETDEFVPDLHAA